jgi:iron(III) transport system substrate-binding protein
MTHRTLRRRSPHLGPASASRRRAIQAALACLTFVALHVDAPAQEVVRFPAKGQVPPGYRADYAATIAAAEQEGALVIHSTTDLNIARALIDDFQELYPRIEVLYQDMNSTDLDSGYLSDLLTSPSTADILWSSAMDLQFRLVNAGHARPYDSPEIAKIPPWAVWKNLAFGTTYEPIVIAYNKRLLPADEVPQTHADLTRLLTERRDRFLGKLVTYDVQRSGLGFLLATQSERASQDFWPLVKAMGSAGARLVPTTEAMLAGVGKGSELIGYNALGPYAAMESKKDAALSYVYPKDYTLVVTRIMFIGEKALHPNAAKLWVDYLLSKRGQTALATRANLPSVRPDVEGPNSAAELQKTLGSSARPIPIGPELIATFGDQQKRLAFMRQWQQAFANKP